MVPSIGGVVVRSLASGAGSSAQGADGAERALTTELLRSLLKSSGVFRSHDAQSGMAQDAFVDVVAAAVARSVQLRVGAQDQAQAAAPVHSPLRGAAAAAEAPAGWDDVVDGRISSDFGPRVDPLTHAHSFHHGIDIAAPRGTPIHAVAGGRVVAAGPAGSYGNLVEIESADGVRFRYAHTDDVMVAVGDVVDAGATIATVGSTGRSTGPHLHLEVRKDGHAVDPETALWVSRATR